MPRGFYSRQQIARIAENVLGAPLRGGSQQGIDAVSATPNYQVGSRLMIGNRVFHYAKAGGSLIPDMGAKVKNPQDVSQEVLGAAATKGDTSLKLTLDNTDGPSYNGLLPAEPDGVGSVHILRHSGALERLKQTGNPKAVQEQLRHSSVQMTLRYMKTLSHEESMAIQQGVDYRW